MSFSSHPKIPAFAPCFSIFILSLVSTGTALPAGAGEILQQTELWRMPLDSPPPRPWLVPGNLEEEGLSVSVSLLPGADDGKHWIQIVDDTPYHAVSIRQNFPRVRAGELRMKLYFERIGNGLGIYLGEENVSGPDTRAVDFKVMGEGRTNLGLRERREAGNMQLEAGVVYPLYIRFVTHPDGNRVYFEVRIEDSNTLIGTAEVETSSPIEGLRITTDSRSTNTEVYVSDISLKSRD